jgi:glucokinase
MKDKQKYVIGFDLGGTKVLAALFDRKFQIVAEIKEKSKPQKGEKYFMGTLQDCYEDLLHQTGVRRSEILGIGVGCPGLIDEAKGQVLASPNLAFMQRMSLAKEMSKKFGSRVVIGNDVNIGLFGEHQFGAARGYQNVVGIFVGTGIGGALILNGQLYAGSTGGAGEIGHIQVDPEGPLCGCGRYGCFEALCSRLSIANEAAALVARQKAPHLLESAGTDLLDIKSGQLAEAIRAGDRAIEELLRRKAHLMGRVMADVTHMLNPELFVLGGGLVEAIPSLIVKEATRALQENAMPVMAKHVRVVAAKLGDHAIVMGAAKRAYDTFGARNAELGPAALRYTLQVPSKRK